MAQKRNTIAIIIGFFGKAPWYFPFFVESCRYNPQVDFIIFTDLALTEDHPANIIFVKSSLRELEALISEKLQTEICLPRPYKLCDFRPAFGVIFAGFLEEYDFWGYGDIDLVFGNIRSFINDEMLAEYDVLSMRQEYMTGFFSLYRNNEQCNNLFRESKDHIKIFQSPRHYCFDECNWEWDPLLKGRSIFDLETEIESITEVVQRQHREGTLKAHFNTIVIEGVPGNLQWNRGELIHNKDQKVLLYHLIDFKRLPLLQEPGWATVPDNYHIHACGFSRTPPALVWNRLTIGAVTLKNKWSLQASIAGAYIKWLVKYILASRRINYNEIGSIQKLTGRYGSGKLIVEVKVINDCLYALLGNKRFRLLHNKGHSFVLEKLRYDELINIDFEFTYDKRLQDYWLLIKAATDLENIVMYKL